MRSAFAILCSCVLLGFSSFVGSAQAGDYYDGYYPRRAANVWYSSDCCYKKIVRHVRQVRYVRNEPYRRYGYYDAPRYRESYYAPPRDRYYAPARYTETYDVPRYSGYAPRYSTYRSYDGYRGYDAYNAVSDCSYNRRIPVADGRGGWVWGYRTGCY